MKGSPIRTTQHRDRPAGRRFSPWLGWLLAALAALPALVVSTVTPPPPVPVAALQAAASRPLPPPAITPPPPPPVPVRAAVPPPPVVAPMARAWAIDDGQTLHFHGSAADLARWTSTSQPRQASLWYRHDGRVYHSHDRPLIQQALQLLLVGSPTPAAASTVQPLALARQLQDNAARQQVLAQQQLQQAIAQTGRLHLDEPLRSRLAQLAGAASAALKPVPAADPTAAAQLQQQQQQLQQQMQDLLRQQQARTRPLARDPQAAAQQLQALLDQAVRQGRAEVVAR